MSGGPIWCTLPWLVNEDGEGILGGSPDGKTVEEKAVERIESIIDALMWVRLVELVSADERDAALFVVLRELGRHFGAERRRGALGYLLRNVHCVTRFDVPASVLTRAATANAIRFDVHDAIERWLATPYAKPRFVVVRPSREIDNLLPFDTAKIRTGVTVEVDRVLGREIERYYDAALRAPHDAPDPKPLVEALDEVLYGGKLDAVVDDVTDRHRVMALRWVLLDKRLPLRPELLQRVLARPVAPNGEQEPPAPPGTIDAVTYGRLESALAPLVAALVALHTSPILWQRTQTWALVLSLISDLRGDRVGQCDSLRESVGARLKAFDTNLDLADKKVRDAAIVTFLSAAARHVEAERAPAEIAKELERLL